MNKKKLILLMMVCIVGISPGFTQGLPPIFDSITRQIAPSRTVASFPPKTFLENLIFLPDGSILANSHYEGVVYRIKINGDKEKFAHVRGKLTGIAMYGKDGYILTGSDENDLAAIYHLNSNGVITKLISLPEAQFINGITYLTGDDFLVADSYKGCIWKINARQKSASVWLEDGLLKRGDENNPTPAANGIKILNNTVFVSNTQKQLLLRIKIVNNKPQRPEVFVEKVNLDDFVFDRAGNLYGATHVYNSIIKITLDKKITVIAEQPQGVSGSTACILKEDVKGYSLYVSTNGGMYFPPPTGIEESKIISLHLTNKRP